MNPDQLARLDPWLRLWRLRSFGQNEIEVARLTVSHAGPTDTPLLGEAGFTHLYRIDGDDLFGARYLVQIRAEGDTIVNTADPPQLLDADFRGARLPEDDLDLLWEIDDTRFLDPAIAQAVWNRFVATGEVLPQSGDGTAGGRFNSWFQVLLQIG